MSARASLRSVLLCAAFALLLGFRLGDRPVTRQAEERVSDVAQNMVLDGDWLVPQRNGKPWLNKPPLYYWSSALVYELRGVFDGWSLRAPAALSALALFALAWIWGRRLGRPGAGILAALLWAMALEVASHGRQGVAEMTMSLFVGLAWYACARLEQGGERRWYAVYGLAFTLAILAKATVPVMLVLLPVTLFLALERRLGRAWRARRPLLWTAGAIAAGFSWYVAVGLRVPGAFDHFFQAATLPAGVQSEVGAEHYKPFWAHVGNLFGAGLPASLLAPVWIVPAWRTRLWRGDPQRRLLGLFLVASFVAFSILPQKRKVYMLPLLLPLALLTADGLLAAIERRGKGLAALRRGVSLGSALLAVLIAALAGLYLGEVLGLSPRAWGPVVVLALGAGGWSAWAAAKERWVTAATAFGLLWGTLVLVNQGSFEVWSQQFRTGAVACRTDFDEARWKRLLAEHAFLRRHFHESAGLVGRYFGPGARTGEHHPRCGAPPVIPPVERPPLPERAAAGPASEKPARAGRRGM